MDDNVSEDFYNPVLKESISYKRVSGYFSCKALSIYAEGLDRIADARNEKGVLLFHHSLPEILHHHQSTIFHLSRGRSCPRLSV